MESAPLIGITMDIVDGRLSLREEYLAALRGAGGQPLLVPPGRESLGLADVISGLLIPGGGDLDPGYYGEQAMGGLSLVDRRRSDFEMAMIHAIIRLRKPLLGICYGMQIVNVALGGSLYQDIGSQVPGALDHREGHAIEAPGRRPLAAGSFEVNSSHHQAVKELGRGLEVLAVSADGLPEAVGLVGYPFFLGVQWHPERPGGLPEMALNTFVEACRAA
ncbi:MAG: type 1 glutamine amidotransferase [Thermodesulfovibrionales bacterium]